MKSDNLVAEQDVASAIEAVFAGDHDAFALIVNKFQDSIMTFALALMKNRQAAEELTQDAFIRAYHRLPSFDVARHMKPWLVKITYRLALNVWRGQSVEAKRRRLERDRLNHVSPDSAPLEDIIADERARALWQAVESLSFAERTAVILYYREGLTLDEVAKITAVSAGTIKSLLFRARNHLRVFLCQRNVLSQGGSPHEM